MSQEHPVLRSLGISCSGTMLGDPDLISIHIFGLLAPPEASALLLRTIGLFEELPIRQMRKRMRDYLRVRSLPSVFVSFMSGSGRAVCGGGLAVAATCSPHEDSSVVSL